MYPAFSTRVSAIMEDISAFTSKSYLKLLEVKRNMKRLPSDTRKMKTLHCAPKCASCVLSSDCCGQLLIPSQRAWCALFELCFISSQLPFLHWNLVMPRFSEFLGLTFWPGLLSLNKGTFHYNSNYQKVHILGEWSGLLLLQKTGVSPNAIKEGVAGSL